MVAVENNQPATNIIPNKPKSDTLKLSKLRSSQFLTLSGSLDTYVNAKVSTQKEDYTIVAQACFFTLSFRVISSLHMWGMAINW